jgi:hypothetical protein
MTAAAKQCPFCGSRDTVKEADFATSLMVNRRHCRHCHSFFEAIKWGDRSDELDLPGFLRSSGEPHGHE